MSESNTSGSDNKTNDSRWWEFYVVRYFLGTVVGGAILLYLNTNSSLTGLIIPGVKDFEEVKADHLWLLAALGLAYCYVASAPVLVLHAARGALWALSDKTNKPDNTASKKTSIYFYISLMVIGGMMIGFPALQSAPDKQVFLSRFLLAFVFFLQIVPLALSAHKDGERIHVYYTNLTKARSSRSDEAKQYVESYKHLREHGNAFFILLFELALGIILTFETDKRIAFIALLLWILPAALVWMIGSVLEYRFTNEQLKLINDKNGQST